MHPDNNLVLVIHFAKKNKASFSLSHTEQNRTPVQLENGLFENKTILLKKDKNKSAPGLQILRSFKLLSKHDSPPHIIEVFDSILVIES